MARSAPDELVEDLALLVAALRGCSGIGCIAASEAGISDLPGVQHRCFWQDCQFSFTGVADRADAPGTAEWDFGDGSSATGSEVSHRFEEGGLYEVSVTASYGNAELKTTRWVSTRVPEPVISVSGLDVAPREERGAANGKVSVIDGRFLAVEGASVTVRWRVGADRVEIDEGLTNDKGRATFTLPRLESGDQIEFCVTDVSFAGLDFQPSAECFELVYP